MFVKRTWCQSCDLFENSDRGGMEVLLENNVWDKDTKVEVIDRYC